jgi:hypothetical protein
MNHDGNSRPLTAATLVGAHPRRRVDLLRQALRTRSLDPARVAADLPDWIELFRASDDPALLVLVLELLREVADDRVVELARAARHHRGDGVRLEALRLLLDRDPRQVERLALEHRADRSLEVQLLLIERLHEVAPSSALDFLFEVLDAECDGPREPHALERGVEFLVEKATSEAVLARLRSIQPDFDDPEGFITWGIEQMEMRLS